jgi:hypothetical protein
MPSFISSHVPEASTSSNRTRYWSPPRPKCDTIMILARVTPDGAGYQYIFECPACDHLELEVVRFR